MQKLSKDAQKAIRGGETLTECLRNCREFLSECSGPAKSDCPEYLACLNGCYAAYGG